MIRDLEAIMIILRPVQRIECKLAGIKMTQNMNQTKRNSHLDPRLDQAEADCNYAVG